MPSKKKGKGSKFARMSDEERLRYLQHRAELEIEAKRRKQQLIAIFTKNKLKREEAFSRLNTAKINEQWRYILRQIKCKELYESVQYSWKNFISAVTRKNITIKRLYDSLTVSHANNTILQESHMKTINDITGKNEVNGSKLYQSYQLQLQKIIHENLVELNRLTTNIIENRKILEGAITNQRFTLEDRITETKTRNAISMQTIFYSKENTLFYLIQQSSTKMENLRKELNKIMAEYEGATKYKWKQYTHLKEQDDMYQIAVTTFPRVRLHLQKTIENLKSDLNTLCYNRNKSITRLNNQKERAKDTISRIRMDFIIAKAVNRSRLGILSIASKDIITNLQIISEKGSTLLLINKLCCRLEPLSLAIKMYCVQDIKANIVNLENSTFAFFHKLDKFWKLYSYARAVYIHTQKQRSIMSLENKLLRQNFKTYLLSISMTPTVKPSRKMRVHGAFTHYTNKTNNY